MKPATKGTLKMTKFAFMDTNAGYFQGAYEANTLEDAIKFYASDVGLIEEIDLSTYYAEISSTDEKHLNQWADADFSNDDQDLSDKLDKIQWDHISDYTVRVMLGYKA